MCLVTFWYLKPRTWVIEQENLEKHISIYFNGMIHPDQFHVFYVGCCEGQFTQPPFHHSEWEILNLANEFSTHPNSPKG